MSFDDKITLTKRIRNKRVLSILEHLNGEHLFIDPVPEQTRIEGNPFTSEKFVVYALSKSDDL